MNTNVRNNKWFVSSRKHSCAQIIITHGCNGQISIYWLHTSPDGYLHTSQPDRRYEIDELVISKWIQQWTLLKSKHC